MGNLEIKIDAKPLDKIKKELTAFPKEAKAAEASAVKRSIGAMKTEAWRYVGKAYTIKQKDFYEHTRTTKDSLIIEGDRLTMHHFKTEVKREEIVDGMKQTTTTKKNGINKATVKTSTSKAKKSLVNSKRVISSVRVQIRKDRKFGPFKGIEVKGKTKTVKAKMPFPAGTGAASAAKVQRILFMRTGASRMPVQAVRTISPAQMIAREDIRKNVEERGNEILQKRVDAEIKYRLDKMAKKASTTK